MLVAVPVTIRLSMPRALSTSSTLDAPAMNGEKRDL
jgi:hypothetical protein